MQTLEEAVISVLEEGRKGRPGQEGFKPNAGHEPSTFPWPNLRYKNEPSAADKRRIASANDQLKIPASTDIEKKEAELQDAKKKERQEVENLARCLSNPKNDAATVEACYYALEQARNAVYAIEEEISKLEQNTGDSTRFRKSQRMKEGSRPLFGASSPFGKDELNAARQGLTPNKERELLRSAF